jgi:crotonobetainyl-CoA:carnitine CoA-transferase CaiB-like acyl-CoA transferase
MSPLGLRVIEISTGVARRFAGMTLADWGVHERAMLQIVESPELGPLWQAAELPHVDPR